MSNEEGTDHLTHPRAVVHLIKFVIMPSSIRTETITEAQVAKLLALDEGQFNDLKAKEVSAHGLSKAISAFANTDGGELYVGIQELVTGKKREWAGFPNDEAANAHIQELEKYFPLGTDFQYEFLRAGAFPGLVLHLQINKAQGIIKASNSIPYVRRGAQSLPVQTPEEIKRLEYAKGITTFETEPINAPKEVLIESRVIKDFVEQVVPTTTPEKWLRKQVLLREERPTVAGVLLFAEEPQALIPKHCGIKVYRYKTTEPEGTRETLAFDPMTIEGDLYAQIKAAVAATKNIVESIPKLGESALQTVNYPPETLHEIITNAVLHRDYHVADDVHIRIFDNRIEVQSPGTLPAHVTIQNILTERFARNGTIVRILNKFPDPPNKDVGEGLNTAFEAMTKLGLKPPAIVEQDNSLLVLIKHERLASPEEAIMDYLTDHPSIKNKDARRITHITADYRIKTIFGRMEKADMIEQIPGTRTASTAYRIKVPSSQREPETSNSEQPIDSASQQAMDLEVEY